MGKTDGGREIKFRALSEHGWKIIDLTGSTGWARGLLELLGKDDKAFQFKTPLEQFTGLKDKNGVEIYEGDIVKDPQGNVGEVFYLRTSWMVRWHRRDGSWDTDSCIEYGEVIGNTHENPELLK